MKNRKTFFDNNTLNKGYDKAQSKESQEEKQPSTKQSDLLPPIELLAEYEEISPGTLSKIISMAEKEQAHRHSMEEKAIENHKNAVALGRNFALIIAVFLGIVTVTLAFLAHVYFGVMLLITMLAGGGALLFRCKGKSEGSAEVVDTKRNSTPGPGRRRSKNRSK